MEYTLEVDNIKCGGCANSIQKKIKERHDVKSVEVDVEQGRVSIESNDDLRGPILETLSSIGYPEHGSIEGLDSLKAKAKSFVSCAIGRMDKQDEGGKE